MPNQSGRLPLSRQFHVRVMLPCYRESLELIQVSRVPGYQMRVCTAGLVPPQLLILLAERGALDPESALLVQTFLAAEP